MAKELRFDQEARRRLEAGVDKLADSVRVTQKMAATTFGAPQVRNRRITGARMKLRRAAIANGSTMGPARYKKRMISAAIVRPCAMSARPLVLMNRIGTKGALWSRGSRR